MTDLKGKKIIDKKNLQIYIIEEVSGDKIILNTGGRINKNSIGVKYDFYKETNKSTATKKNKKQKPLNENNNYKDDYFSQLEKDLNNLNDNGYKKKNNRDDNYNQPEYNNSNKNKNYQQNFDQNQFNQNNINNSYNESNSFNNNFHNNNDYFSDLEKELENLNDDGNNKKRNNNYNNNNHYHDDYIENNNYKQNGSGYNEEYLRKKEQFKQNQYNTNSNSHNNYNDININEEQLNDNQDYYEEPVNYFKNTNKNTNGKKSKIKEEIDNISDEIKNEIIKNSILEKFNKDYKYKFNLEIIEHSLNPEAILFTINHTKINIIEELTEQIVSNIIANPTKLKQLISDKLKYEININKSEVIDI